MKQSNSPLLHILSHFILWLQASILAAFPSFFEPDFILLAAFPPFFQPYFIFIFFFLLHPILHYGKRNLGAFADIQFIKKLYGRSS